MRRFEAVFAEWAVWRHWWLTVAIVLAVLTSARGLRLLTFNNDTRVFFSDQNV